MRLYIDDDSVNPGLLRLLRRDGHKVLIPADVGMVGSSDQVHLAYAIRDTRAILTRNHKDFDALEIAQVRPEDREFLGKLVTRRAAVFRRLAE